MHTALKTALETRAGIAYLQEPPVEKHSIIHPRFLLYWPKSPQKHAQVITTVRRDIVDKMIIKAHIDLIGHPYFVVLDVVEQERRTRVVNYYNN
jgi:hypothetical protein